MSAASADDGNRLAPTRAGRVKRSMTAGDAPETVLGRYLIERDKGGRNASFFRDHRETEPRFVDAGRSLRSANAYPDAVRDMLQIAKHRGWDQLKVTGDVVFRREVWLQGQTLGLDVRGHKPTDRDRQAAGGPRDRPRRDGRDLSERLDRAAVVVRALIADPAAQARLMARALTRASERDPERSAPRDQRQRSR